MKFHIILISFLILTSSCFALETENPVISKFKQEAKKLGYKDWQIKIGLSMYTNTIKGASLDEFLTITKLTGNISVKEDCNINYIMHIKDNINVYDTTRKEIVTINGSAFKKHNHENQKPKNKTVAFYKCNKEQLVEIPVQLALLN